MASHTFLSNTYELTKQLHKTNRLSRTAWVHLNQYSAPKAGKNMSLLSL